MVPKENLENWLNYLKKELPTVVFKASTKLKDKGKMTKVPFTVSAGKGGSFRFGWLKYDECTKS